jgi:hypothetical protein
VRDVPDDTDMEPEAGDVTSEAGAKLEVGDVTGDTDMEPEAGDMTSEVGSPASAHWSVRDFEPSLRPGIIGKRKKMKKKVIHLF